MIGTIVKREFISKVLTLRFLMGFTVCLALIVANAKVLVRDYEGRLRGYDTVVQEYEDRMREVKVYSELGQSAMPKAFRRPSALSIFNEGMDKKLGNVVSCPHGWVPYEAELFGTDNPYLAVFPSIDLAVIFQIVLSLLALLFAYDAVSGEKEEGSLRLALSNPVPRDTVLVGKYIGGMTALALPLIVSLGFGLLILLFSPYISFGTSEWIRLIVIFVVSMLYVSAFYLLGMLISSRTHRTSTTLIWVLFIWALSVLVFPSATAFLVDRFGTTDVYEKIRAQEGELRTQFDKEVQGFVEEKGKEEGWWRINRTSRNRNPGRYGETVYVTGVGLEAEDWALPFMQRLYAFQEPLRIQYADRIGRIHKALREEQGKRADLVRDISRISPAAAYYHATAILSGTDLGSYWGFMDQARRYRSEIIQYLHDEGMFSSRRWFNDERVEDGVAHRLGPADLSGMPRFREIGESLSESLKRAAVDVLILVLMNVLFFGISYLSFLRYDPR